jgi:hypothetical protein
MNQVKTIKNLKVANWFLNQLDQPESIGSEFYWKFLLVFILRNLNLWQKEQFLRIVTSGKTDQIMPFITSCLPDFAKNFEQALAEKLTEIRKKVNQK